MENETTTEAAQPTTVAITVADETTEVVIAIVMVEPNATTVGNQVIRNTPAASKKKMNANKHEKTSTIINVTTTTTTGIHSHAYHLYASSLENQLTGTSTPGPRTT